MLKLPGQLRWLWVSALVIAVDQITKLLASDSIAFEEVIPVMPHFNLTLVYNRGAAFSFLADQPGWQRWFFIVLTLVVSIAIVRWMFKMTQAEKWSAIGLAMILGGAIGNVIDRIYLGKVIDFIDWYYGGYHWPAFNIADSAILVGAGIMIVCSFYADSRAAKNKEEQA